MPRPRFVREILLVLGSIAVLAFVQSSGRILLGSDLRDGFYGEEPPFDVDRAPWLGVVVDGQEHALRSVALEWMPLERAEGADGPTYRLSSDPEDPVLLFSEIPGLRPGDVEVGRPMQIGLSEPAPSAQVMLGESRYELSLESAYPEECRAVVTLSHGGVSQAIPVEAVLGCGDPHFTIHWAGDLDGDGALDVVATFSMKYSYHPRQLYLSTRAEPGALVGLAAATTRTAS